MERGSEPFNSSPFPTFSAAWNCAFKVRQSLTETSGNSLGRGHRNVSSNHPETPTMPRQTGVGQHGLSLTELLIVLAIIMVVVAFEIPVAITSVRTGKVRGAAKDYAGLLQIARIRAVDDNRYYSVCTQAATGPKPQMAYVDMYPAQVPGNSGGTPTCAGSYYNGPPADPYIPLPAEIVPRLKAAAPSTTNLEGQICPGRGAAFIYDGLAPNTGPTFGPEGLPCHSFGGTCNTGGGPACFITFSSPTAGRDLVCGWIGSAPALAGDRTNASGTCDAESLVDSDDDPSGPDPPAQVTDEGAVSSSDGKGLLVYFATSDIDASVLRVAELGGSASDPAAIPGVGRYATCADTEGNAFGLFESEQAS